MLVHVSVLPVTLKKLWSPGKISSLVHPHIEPPREGCRERSPPVFTQLETVAGRYSPPSIWSDGQIVDSLGFIRFEYPDGDMQRVGPAVVPDAHRVQPTGDIGHSAYPVLLPLLDHRCVDSALIGDHQLNIVGVVVPNVPFGPDEEGGVPGGRLESWRRNLTLQFDALADGHLRKDNAWNQ
jgi:hypothetical protein